MDFVLCALDLSNSIFGGKLRKIIMHKKTILIGVVLFTLVMFSHSAKAENMPSVVINELMWMGSAFSAYDEWIELKNTTAEEIDLSGWYLTKKSGGLESQMLIIPAGKKIAGAGFFVISNYDTASTSCVLNFPLDIADSAVSLANSALQIKLYDAAGNLIDTADDGSGNPLAGEYTSGQVWKSMERNKKITEGTLASAWHTAAGQAGFKEGNFVYGTPGLENSNTVPVPSAGGDQEIFEGDQVLFDASDSYDSDGDNLIYAWDFGDGNSGSGLTPTHIYKVIGEYIVTLTVSDGVNQANDSLLVKVAKKEETAAEPKVETGDEQAKISESEIKYDFSDKILFNEIFPNPTGVDGAGEFIELINMDTRLVNLKGWKILIGDKSYTFEADTVIKNADFLVLKYDQTKIYLKNSGATLYLADPNKKIINGVTYGPAKEGLSFARKPGKESWVWTNAVTGGKANMIKVENAASVETVENVITASIKDVKNSEAGMKVKTKGWAAVTPGTFGVQYFYIFDGQNGIMVYSSKKDFPSLKIGDYLEVAGKLSESNGEKKINISTKEDIKIKPAKDFPKALVISFDEIDENMAGSLVMVSGETLSASGSTVVLSNDSGEMEIYLKRGTGLKAKDYKEGEALTVLGILTPYEETYRILPRVGSDLKKEETKVSEAIKSNGGNENQNGAENQSAKGQDGQVLGASENNIDITTDNSPKNMTKYLMLILGGLIIVLSVYLIRYRKNKMKEK